MGSPPFQKHLSTPFLCPALFRVLHLCLQRVHKKKKNRQRLRRKKKKKKRYRTTLSASRILSLLSLSLSAFITPPLEEGQPKAFFGGGRRRRRRRRRSSSSSFSIRREKKEERARENSFLCRAWGAGGFKFKLGNQNDIRGFAFFVGDYIDRAIRARGDTFCAPRDGCFFCVCALKRARRRRDGCVGVWWRWSSSASRTTRGIDDDEKHQWRVFARFVDVRGARVTGMAGTTTTTNGREDGENEN
mgnify:CR=1 FL=1